MEKSACTSFRSRKIFWLTSTWSLDVVKGQKGKKGFQTSSKNSRETKLWLYGGEGSWKFECTRELLKLQRYTSQERYYLSFTKTIWFLSPMCWVVSTKWKLEFVMVLKFNSLHLNNLRKAFSKCDLRSAKFLKCEGLWRSKIGQFPFLNSFLFQDILIMIPIILQKFLFR